MVDPWVFIGFNRCSIFLRLSPRRIVSRKVIAKTTKKDGNVAVFGKTLMLYRD